MESFFRRTGTGTRIRLTKNGNLQRDVNLCFVALRRNQEDRRKTCSYIRNPIHTRPSPVNLRLLSRFSTGFPFSQFAIQGCGNPLCVIIDRKPMRFLSVCEFVNYVSINQRKQQVNFIQKGDCYDISKFSAFVRCHL